MLAQPRNFKFATRDGVRHKPCLGFRPRGMSGGLLWGSFLFSLGLCGTRLQIPKCRANSFYYYLFKYFVLLISLATVAWSNFFFFFKCTGPSGGNPRFPFCGQIKNKKQKKKTNKPISSIQNLANWGLSLISTIIRVLCRCLVSMKRWKWPKNKNYKFFFFF